MKEICIEHYGNDGSPNCAAGQGEPAAQSGEAPLQQLKAEIAAFVHTVVANQGECLQQNVDNFIERMRQLSAV